jgi:mRNA interferase MazF
MLVWKDGGKMKYKPKQGDIVVMDFDPAIGHEQKGRRPALVVTNEHFNRHCKMAMVCPITNTDKQHAFHVQLDNSTNTKGFILCDQSRVLDINARNAVYKESVSEELMDEVIDLICSFVE